MPCHLPLVQVADLQVGLPTRAAGPEAVPCLTASALDESGRLVGKPEPLTPDTAVTARYRIEQGDILLACRSTTVRCGLVAAHQAQVPFNATVIRIRSNPVLLHPEILLAWLCQPAGREAVAACSRSGTHQLNITVSSLSALQVPVPAPERQTALVALLETADTAHRFAIRAARLRLAIARQVALESFTAPA
jgi:hypothetical protein